MKQLDIDVIPPAFVWTHYLTVTLVTFHLDPVTLTSRLYVKYTAILEKCYYHVFTPGDLDLWLMTLTHQMACRFTPC